MPMVIKAQADATELFQALAGLQTINKRLLHKSLGEENVNIIGQRFLTSRDPKGRRWKPIKKYYASDLKRYRFPSQKPLVRINLFKSFSYKADESGVDIGTPVKHAKFHTNFPQNNQRPRKVIPRREYLGVESSKDKRRNIEVVIDFLKEVVR